MKNWLTIRTKYCAPFVLKILLILFLFKALYSQDNTSSKVTEESDLVMGRVNLTDYEFLIKPGENHGYQIEINAPEDVKVERLCLISKGIVFQNVVDSLFFEHQVPGTSFDIVTLNRLRGHFKAVEFEIDKINKYWDGEIIYNFFKSHFDKRDDLTLVYSNNFMGDMGLYLIADGPQEISFELSARDSCYVDTSETLGGEIQPHYLTEGSLSMKIKAKFARGKFEIE